MYETFGAAFTSDYLPSKEKDVPLGLGGSDFWISELFLQFGGQSFNRGSYRIMQRISSGTWNQTVEYAFPQFTGRIQCFSYDWLGRIFATDTGRLEDGCAGVLMFDPGAGQALEVPCNILTFHERELIEFREEALAISFYNRWLLNSSPPHYNECVGYKTPLFFGGDDDIGNLEIANLDVYWALASQVIRKTRGLPNGTPIRNITIF